MCESVISVPLSVVSYKVNHNNAFAFVSDCIQFSFSHSDLPQCQTGLKCRRPIENHIACTVN